MGSIIYIACLIKEILELRNSYKLQYLSSEWNIKDWPVIIQCERVQGEPFPGKVLTTPSVKLAGTHTASLPIYIYDPGRVQHICGGCCLLRIVHCMPHQIMQIKMGKA